MPIAIEPLIKKFRPCQDLDFQGRHFRTLVPSVGDLAYLNIIYDAAEIEVQQQTIDPLRLPLSIREFYRKHNGADLFANNLSIYGFYPSAYLIERNDWRKSLPYNIIQTNQEYFSNTRESDIFVFGSYGFDRSELFIEKATGIVHCSVGDDLSRIRKTWPSFDTWITEEITRMCDFFDEEGHQLVDQEDMLPVTIN